MAAALVARRSAWISSTITVRTVRSISRLRSEVRIRYSDSGVVTRMCGGVLQHRRALGGVRVAGPEQHANIHVGELSRRELLADPLQRLGQILLDVGRQGLQRRDVDDLGLVPQCSLEALSQQPVDRGEKRGEGLAGAGGRGDQNVAARIDRGPGTPLRLGRLGERALEPALHGGVKRGQGH